jgi:hypothetical protein
MRSHFSKTAAIFFSPETLLPFLMGSVFLAVLGNAVWQILLNLLGTTTFAVAQIALGSILIFLLSVLLFARGLKHLESDTLPNARIPRQHPGLILLVSREQPCRIAIQYHLPTLNQCWLLCSHETRSIATTITQEFTAQSIQFTTLIVNNIYDPLEYYQQIKRIYDHLPKGWTVKDVIADYTGMTAHGSVGMVLASLSPNAPLQYTPAHPTKPNESLTPIEITLKPTS